jgi:hypothetical protein
LPGEFSSNDGTSCLDCLPGTYSAVPSNTCLDCPAGYTAAIAGQTACDECPIGYYAPTAGLTDCTACDPGYTTSGTASTTCDVLLPIELTSFFAKVENDVVRLHWQVAMEVNTSFYVLQKSTDGEQWTTISRQNGTGTSYKPLQYQAVDPFPANGSNYYRLKEMAFDGKASFFPILHVDYQFADALKIYPNPVSGGQLNVAFESGTVREISIFDQQGRQWQRLVYPETHIATLEVGHLPAGLYNLVISTDGRMVHRRIVVRR